MNIIKTLFLAIAGLFTFANSQEPLRTTKLSSVSLTSS